MIARKIVYQGSFTATELETIFDIVRQLEITGEVKMNLQGAVELDLEGDPSMIKLIEHQVERRVRANIKSKNITQIPYKHYAGVTLIR